MKPLKTLVLAAIVVVALLAIGRLFLSHLGTERKVEGPPGVILSAPPGVDVTELGDVSPIEAARVLSERIQASGGEPEVGVHFFPAAGREVFWYLERGSQGQEILVERRSGPGSTRLETRWTGEATRRLEWAATHGSFDAPQLPAGEERNLYH